MKIEFEIIFQKLDVALIGESVQDCPARSKGEKKNYSLNRFISVPEFLQLVNEQTDLKEDPTRPKLVTSQKGNPMLFHVGYYYTRHNKRVKSSINWICSQYHNHRCRASCILKRDGRFVAKGRHNHPPAGENSLKR